VVSSTPRPHFTPGKDPVPILQEAGWAPGPVWTGGKSHPHRDSIPDPPARSQSLYRLSYPAHTEVEGRVIFGGAVSIGVTVVLVAEQIFRHPVEVERVNTGRLKNTYTNTYGSKFTQSKRNEPRRAITSDFKVLGFVFGITL